MNWLKKIDKRLWQFTLPVLTIEIIGLLAIYFVFKEN